MKSMIPELSFKKINAQVKNIFVLCLLLFLSSNLFAQFVPSAPPPPPPVYYAPPPAPVRMHFGLEITPSIAWLKAEETTALLGNGSKVGFDFGLITEFGITRNYSFATGIDISYRGGNLETSYTDNNLNTYNVIQTKYSLEYIEIPLTLKMKTNEIGYLTYFGQVGLAPGINISSSGEIQKQTAPVAQPSNVTGTDSSGVDISKDINTFNLSLIIRVGAEYSLGGSTTALIAITFDNGFVSVVNGNQKNVMNGVDQKAISNCLGLTLGVLF